jgi:hypothetical protein
MVNEEEEDHCDGRDHSLGSAGGEDAERHAGTGALLPLVMGGGGRKKV